MRILLSSLTGGAALAVLAATPALADETPRPSNAGGATVSLAANSVAAGASLRFTGTGWVNDSSRGQVVTLKIDDVDILGDVTASDAGAITGAVKIPSSTAAGKHWLRLLAGSGQANDNPARSLASGYFTVTAKSGATTPATPTASSSSAPAAALAKTGVDAGPWLTGAIALPVAGIALLLLERRRRQRAS